MADVLEHEGFEKIGVNLVARTASVDKVLIYRYFVGAFGESADIWWTVDEIVGGDLPGPKQDTLSAWCTLALTRQVEALRQRQVTQQVLLWELSQSNALTQHLNRIREERMQLLVRRVIELGGKRSDARLMALHGLIGSASEYLVLIGHASQTTWWAWIFPAMPAGAGSRPRSRPWCAPYLPRKKPDLARPHQDVALLTG